MTTGKYDINRKNDITEIYCFFCFCLFVFLKGKLKKACYLRDNRGELIEELTTMILQTVSNKSKQLQGKLLFCIYCTALPVSVLSKTTFVCSMQLRMFCVSL